MDEQTYRSLIEIRRFCEKGTQAHGDEFYGPILDELEKLERAEGITTKGESPFCTRCGEKTDEVIVLDGDRLCKHCADKWVQGERPDPRDMEP